MKAQIKHGAIIGCDMHQCRWENGGEIFDVKPFTNDTRRLEAPNYGGKPYGNGCLYVKVEDLIMEDAQEMKEHNHGATSNTDEVFRTFIGCRVKGLVRENTFDGHYANILVFECGWGLANNSNGSHWTVEPDKLQGHIKRTREELADKQRELEHILKLAGQ